MNVFVLSTGRCGSTTFARACQYVTNYTSAHESKTISIGKERIAYPENHIEADNRLSWFLGRLEQAYGDSAFYVHLTRNAEEVARSYARRFEAGSGIMKAYRNGILMGFSQEERYYHDIALDYCHTVNSNIEAFLKDKTRKMDFQLENAEADFRAFWDAVGAEGDFDKALVDFGRTHNASIVPPPQPGLPLRAFNKVKRLCLNLPAYIANT